jgi:hypothetical protein
MREDLSPYKPRLKEYLQKKSINILMIDGAERINCPNHEDKKPSAIVYEESLHCPVCAASWDVFEVAKLLTGVDSFPKQIEEVKKILGEPLETNFKPEKKKNKKEFAKVTPLTYEKAKQIFNSEKLLSMSEFVGKGDPKNGFGDKITGAWPYKNDDGLIEIIDIRFEGGKRKKNIITFYWDGNNVKSANYPVCVYNRNLIKEYPSHILLIVEGAKTAQAAECLIEFGIVPITWNGGSAKILKANWDCTKGRDTFFFPDDDPAGIKAAKAFEKSDYPTYINDWKIIPPFIEARKIKNKGADIVEILQLISPKELAEYIKSAPDMKDSEPPPKPENEFKGAPFRVLGVAEDKKAYFIDRNDRLFCSTLETFSRNKLLMLAPIHYWTNTQGVSKMSTDDWLNCQDDVIEITGSIDFDLNDIRGRGAWREKDSRLCFHDGQKTHGEYDESKVFLRKPKINIGIGSGTLDQETIDNIKEAVFSMSFESKSDAMRLLSWSILAPFSGALQWRPQAFLTGPSSSGKSSIENYVVKPLSLSDRYNGGKTSAAGYIQARKSDCGAVTIEEADPDTEKKKTYKEDLLSVMRQSTSDDTPRSAMGTADQTGTSYITRDMFLFVAISPEVESVADENRLVKINITKPGKSRPWSKIKESLVKNITESNCKKLRNMVWENLKKIIYYSDKIATIIQDYTGNDHRFSISEGTLMSAYLIIWKGIKEPKDDQILEFVKANYDLRNPDDERDDSEEMISKIMQYKVKVDNKEFSISECLSIMHTEKIYTGTEVEGSEGLETLSKAEITKYKRAVNNVGISLDPDKYLSICNNHTEIKRITGRTYGYSKILKRHADCVSGSKNVVFTDGKAKKCTVIAGIVKADPVPF